MTPLTPNDTTRPVDNLALLEEAPVMRDALDALVYHILNHFPGALGYPGLGNAMKNAGESIRRSYGKEPLHITGRRRRACSAVDAERARQDAKWGVQNHPPEMWLAILMEEVGELAEAIIETKLSHPNGHADRGGLDKIHTEAVQVAAVAVAMLECLERTALPSPTSLPSLPPEAP